MTANEGSLLADAVERFFADQCAPELVAAVEAGADFARLWHATEHLGLTLVAVPESRGGAGGSLVDAVTVLRAAGRHAVPLPLSETMLAGWVLAQAGMSVPGGPLTLAPIGPNERLRLAADAGGAIVTGRAVGVPWGGSASRLVVIADDDEGQLYAVSLDPAVLDVTAGASIAREPRDTLDVAAVRVAAGSFAPLAIGRDEIKLRGALMRAALMLGAMERARDLTVAHCRGRSQFGRPISKFQAVQQLLAQIAREVALTRAAVDLATAAAADELASAWLEIASAKVVAGRAAGSVSAWTHQVHGAFGITKEYPLSTLTRRLWCWRDEHGGEEEWSQRIGALAWTVGGGWTLVTSTRLPVGHRPAA